MEWQDLISDGYSRVLEILEPAFKGLSRADLDRRPSADTNSMGWTAWHLTRGQDAQIAALMGEDQVYINNGWHARFDRPADPEDTGFGARSEDVAKFRSPEASVLLGYYRASLERTKRYLYSLSLSDLDRQLDEPLFQPPPTVGMRIVSIMADGLEHAGEIAYIRGLVKGHGWFV